MTKRPASAFSGPPNCAAIRVSCPLAPTLARPTYPSIRTLLDCVRTMIKDDAQPSLLVKGHPDRANSCAKLAVWLWNRFKQTGDLVLLDEAIELEREVVRLRPEGHPDRALSCADLAVSLTTCFERTRDMALLDETIEFEREALRLRPDGHADRAETCRNLAISLRTRFDQTEDMDMLDEALDLEREALRLRPEGHPNRADICGDLAIALWNRFSQTADMRLLDEAITLLRESLRLRPEEHPDYADSCANLSVALTTCFSQTGDSALLDEAIKLQREALRLRPEGHPERAISCANLAVSVWTRFGHTGDMPLLEESVELLRESLRLRPKEHPDRAISCANLAASLWTRFSQTKDMGLLHEALQFDREALRLRPEGHPDRADSCNNLAISLRTCFTETGDTVLLDEALELHREGLRLRPVEHRDRASVCADMALSLRIRFDQTGDTMLLDEARSLCTQTIEQCSLSPSDHVCLRVQLAHIHALPAYASFNPSTAVTYLSEAIQYRAGMIRNFYSFTYALHLCAKATVSDEDHVRLLAVYQAAIEVLPEMGNAILPKISRLHRWQNAGNLPLEALFQALKANDLPAGLELVEQGRAVLWSETLAMQDTQLQGLPVELKEQLQKLLQSLSTVAERGDVQHSDLSARDQAHTSYTQLQQLLKNIRASAGLERFMRGPVYSDLLQVAHTHPAVLLFASTTACHALVISSASVSPAHLILKKIATTDLDVLGHDIRGLDLNIRAMCGLSSATEERGISIDGRRVDPAVRKLHQALKRLWIDIVKPILDCLSFTVCGLALITQCL
jgi:tetratricopeptide (TPR) repeat protein